MQKWLSNNWMGYIGIGLGILLIAETFHWFEIHTHYVARLAGILLILWGMSISNLMPLVINAIDQIRALAKF